MLIHRKTLPALVYTLITSGFALFLLIALNAPLVPVAFCIAAQVAAFLLFREDFELVQALTLAAAVITGSALGWRIGGTHIYYCFWILAIYLAYHGLRLLTGRPSLYRAFPRSGWIAIFLFLAYNIVLALISGNLRGCLFNMVYWLSMAAVFCVFYAELKLSPYADKLIKPIVAMFGVVTLLGLLESIGIDLRIYGFYRDETNNIFVPAARRISSFVMRLPSGFSGNTNHYSVVMTMVFTFGFAGVLCLRKRWQALTAAAAALLALVIMNFSNSRASYLAILSVVVFGLIIYVIRFIREKRRLAVAAMTLAGFIAANMALAHIPLTAPYYRQTEPYTMMAKTIQSVLGDWSWQFLFPPTPAPQPTPGPQPTPTTTPAPTPPQLFNEGGGASMDVRLTIYKWITRQVVKGGCWLGMGAGQSEEFLKVNKVFQGRESNARYITSVHGFPVEVLGDYGIPGVLAYAFINFYFAIKFIRCLFRDRKGSGFVPFMALLMVGGLFVAGFAPSSVKAYPVYFMALGACIGWGSRWCARQPDKVEESV